LIVGLADWIKEAPVLINTDYQGGVWTYGNT